MQESLYWIMALVFAVILIIILINDRLNSESNSKIGKAFQILVSWVIFFCLQDALWGLCEVQIIKSDLVFFISSEIFHISTVITAFFWLYYNLVFLGKKIKHPKLFLGIVGVLIFIEFVFVLSNLFIPSLFIIEDGKYITGHLRPLTFFNQYIVYLAIGIVTFFCGIRAKYSERKKFLTVFIFALFPILLGCCQLLFPEGPFYSMGYFLGCFVVHMFIVAKDRNENARNKILKSLANIYYSMHIFDLEHNSSERIIEPEILRKIEKNYYRPQDMLNAGIKGTVCDEYLNTMLDFVNLSTLSDRMKNKNQISCEFIGKNYGWTRLSFISVDRQNSVLKKVIAATQIIDEEKRKEIELLFKSNHDELTGLYNRHSYEVEISNKAESELEDDLVYVSMDLNGLKTINDTLGHDAGDELIKGAADCMKKCFSLYGKIFRIGGDEFCAIINATEAELEKIKQDFDDMLLHWKGEFVSELAVSCGYIRKSEVDNPTIHSLSTFADKRMYEAKQQFYKQRGIDRRGQKDAHTALCSIYTKILKINITKDSYQIINMDIREQSKLMGFEEKISKWLYNFAVSGLVYQDDVNDFLSKTDLKFMSEYFASGKKFLSILYRRKIENEFRKVVMDIIPAGDYSNNNQSMFLYVRSID